MTERKALDPEEQKFLEENIQTVAFHLGQPGARLRVDWDNGGLEVLKEISRRLMSNAQTIVREPAYCGDGRKIEVSMATWDGIVHYIKALHKEGAVDDTKMKFAAYFPLEYCMQLWGIKPYKIQHAISPLSPPTQEGGE